MTLDEMIRQIVREEVRSLFAEVARTQAQTSAAPRRGRPPKLTAGEKASENEGVLKRKPGRPPGSGKKARGPGRPPKAASEDILRLARTFSVGQMVRFNRGRGVGIEGEIESIHPETGLTKVRALKSGKVISIGVSRLSPVAEKRAVELVEGPKPIPPKVRKKSAA